jgi:hypothetical protein
MDSQSSGSRAQRGGLCAAGLVTQTLALSLSCTLYCFKLGNRRDHLDGGLQPLHAAPEARSRPPERGQRAQERPDAHKTHAPNIQHTLNPHSGCKQCAPRRPTRHLRNANRTQIGRSHRAHSRQPPMHPRRTRTAYKKHMSRCQAAHKSHPWRQHHARRRIQSSHSPPAARSHSAPKRQMQGTHVRGFRIPHLSAIP